MKELSNQSPKSLWQTLRPLLLISVGLHGLLLLMPMPAKQDSVAETKQKSIPLKTIELTRLPKPSLKPSPLPKPVKPVKPPQPQAIVLPPAPAPIAEQPIVAPSPSPSPSPTPSPSPSPSPSPTPSPSPSPPAPPITILGEVPQLPDSKPSCNGKQGCWQVENTQWRSVAVDLEQQLRDQGMEVVQLDLEDDTGIRVYQIIKDGKLQSYLSLVSTTQGTVYVFNPKQLDRTELEKVVGVSIL